MRYAALLAWLALLASLASPPAAASGIGSPLIGTGWSGVTTVDPAAVHWNPSLLADLPGFRLQLAGNLIYARPSYHRQRRATYQHEDGFDFALPLDEASVDAAKTGWDAPVAADVVAPGGSLFASYQLFESLTLGLGVYPAFAAILKLPDQGPHRWQLQEAFVVGLYATPSVAWRITDQVTVGVGGSLVVGGLALRQVVDLAGTPMLGEAFANPPISQDNDFGDDAPPGVRELDVLSRPVTIDQAIAYGFSFNVGVTFDPIDELRLALVYQHGADLVFEGDAYLDMDHDFFTKDLAYQGMQYPGLVRGKAYIEMPLPFSLRAGVAVHPIEPLTLHLQASWVRWSVVESLRVTLESDDLVQEDLGLGPIAKIELPRRWNDTVELELLTTWDFGADARLGLRLGYHSPAPPDSTVDLSSIDGHRIIAGLMGRYQVHEHLALDVWAMLHQVLPREVVASLHDRGNGTYALTVLGLGGALDLSF